MNDPREQERLSIQVQRLERAIRAPIIVTPQQITANQNDYESAGADVLRLSSDAARNVTGLAGGYDGRRLLVLNVGAFNLVLQNQNVGSSALNRILTGTGADVTLGADDTAMLFYDGTTQRWRIINTH